MWKKADKREQIEEQQKEYIQEFNTTMKTFSIDQKEVDRFKASLFASGPVNALDSLSDSSAMFGHADKRGSEKWYHTLDQLRKWETLPAKVRN